MTTSGLAVWNAAIQASWAEPCADEPAPLMVPDRSLAAGVSVPPVSFAAQDARARAPTRAMAARPPERLMFTVFPSGMVIEDVEPGGSVGEATNARKRDSAGMVNER